MKIFFTSIFWKCFVYLCVFHQGPFEGSCLSWKCSLTLILCFVFFIFIFVRFSHLDLLAFLLLVSLYLLSILKSWYEFKTVVLIFEFGIFLIVIVPCHSTSQNLFMLIFLIVMEMHTIILFYDISSILPGCLLQSY